MDFIIYTCLVVALLCALWLIGEAVIAWGLGHAVRPTVQTLDNRELIEHFQAAHKKALRKRPSRDQRLGVVGDRGKPNKRVKEV